jgi:hypothetical protein
MPAQALIAGLIAIAAGGPASTPIGSASGDLVSYILGYGVLGIGVLAIMFRLLVPYWVMKESRDQAEARYQEAKTFWENQMRDARADWEAQLGRVLQEKQHAMDQRDAAMSLAQDRIVPLLTSFVAVSESLIPFMQSQVRDRGRGTP